MADKHFKLYNKSVKLLNLHTEKFQLKKGRSFVRIAFLFRKAVVKNYSKLCLYVPSILNFKLIT